MSKIFLVAGLGFGDEGKGTITEYLATKECAHTVVRYNGGAQAGHNVVLSNGDSHTFSQFGSGTFSGAKTHLSRFMIFDPISLLTEALHLQALGEPDPLSLLTIDQDALVITPYHKAANRIRELNRNTPHGSCGMGIGETVSDALSYPDSTIRVKDLKAENFSGLKDKLHVIRENKFKEFRDYTLRLDEKSMSAFNLLTRPVSAILEDLLEVVDKLNIVSDDYLPNLLSKKDLSFVFEGAQGVLLDEDWGFPPHTTWSKTTFSNALELIPNDSDTEITKIGVIRTYLTRHGAGPFPTEVEGSIGSELHNQTNDWQGSVRYGHFDMVLLRYALDVLGGVDKIAVTHLDSLNTTALRIATSYKMHYSRKHLMEQSDKITVTPKPDLKHQHELREILSSGIEINYWPMNAHFIQVLETLSKVHVGITSMGPCLKDKTERT